MSAHHRTEKRDGPHHFGEEERKATTGRSSHVINPDIYEQNCGEGYGGNKSDLNETTQSRGFVPCEVCLVLITLVCLIAPARANTAQAKNQHDPDFHGEQLAAWL